MNILIAASLLVACAAPAVCAIAGAANWSAAWLVTIAAVTAVAAAIGRPGLNPILAVLVIALTVRVLAVTALLAFAPAPIEELLGPDSRGYLLGARALSEQGLVLPAYPAPPLRTYHVGPHFLFGAGISLGFDLFGLQILNSLLGAIAAALIYAAARQLFPYYAIIIAALVAFNPSLILLSASGLLKDPSVLCASAVVAAGIVFGLADGPRARRWLAWAFVALALVYLRTARFYVAAYFELALVGVATLALLASSRETRRRALGGALFAVAVAELVPWLRGWPLSTQLLVDQIRHTLGAPAMRYASEGLADAVVGDGAKTPVVQVLDVVKRMWGPFIWVLPEHWNRMTLVYTNDYLLYPGTLLWYATLPYLTLGIYATGRDWRLRAQARLWSLVLSIFSLVYLLQFAAVNLSYRQRDAMFPVFILIALVGYIESRRWKRWNLWLALYWGSIVLLAAVHLFVSAVLVG